MGLLFLIFMLLAVVLGLASLVGFVLLDIQAFRESPLWGLLVLFLSPIAAVIFAIRNWEQARKPFLVYAGGFVGSIVLVVLAVGASVGAAVTSGVAEFEQAAAAAVPPSSHAEPQEQAALEQPLAPVAEATAEAGADEAVVDVATLEPTNADAEARTVHVANDLLEPQDDRARRTQDRVAGEEETAQAVDDPAAVPAGYTLVSFGEANVYLGRRVRVLDDEGNLHQGTLSEASRGKLVIEREMSGGTVSYELKPSDVRSLQIYFR